MSAKRTLSEIAREQMRLDARDRASRPLAFSRDVESTGDDLVRRLSAVRRGDTSEPYTREDMEREHAARASRPLAISKDRG